MSASDRLLGDLIDELNANKMVLRPPFQRRLVWTKADKEYFLETVLLGLPFPEIFVCTGNRDPDTDVRTTWLVDGQQRMATLQEYRNGSDELPYKKIKPFQDLSKEERERFLETTVAVRDLKRVDAERLKEIFKRINSTNYQLRAMEVRNALFSGRLKQYCDQLSSQDFFKDHKVFTEGRKKRMEDLAFCVILVTTLLTGYYNRNEKDQEYLHRFNDDFDQETEIQAGLDKVFDFLVECKFDPKSPVWRLTHLFTVLVELYQAIAVQRQTVDVKRFQVEVDSLFERVRDVQGEGSPGDLDPDVLKYWQASKTAANDKYSRVNRAEVLAKLIERCTEPSSRKSRKS